MKKYSKLLLVALLFVSVLFITGCGGSKKTDKKDVAGTYKGIYYKVVGDKEGTYDDEFSLELKEDGTGKNNRNGSSYDVEWSIDGEDFKMTDKFAGMTIDYTGTLKDGKLTIYNGNPEDPWTYEYYYEIEK